MIGPFAALLPSSTARADALRAIFTLHLVRSPILFSSLEKFHRLPLPPSTSPSPPLISYHLLPSIESTGVPISFHLFLPCINYV